MNDGNISNNNNFTPCSVINLLTNEASDLFLQRNSEYRSFSQRHFNWLDKGRKFRTILYYASSLQLL